MNYPSELVSIIKRGGHAVIPTDTIYGIVCDALSEHAVEALYKIRKRTPSKPFIVLIADIAQLELFGIAKEKYVEIVRPYWPGPVSIILPCPSKRFEYLHRGHRAIAFRLPANKALQDLIREAGPLVAPSANLEGFLPVTTIEEAKRYFGNEVSFYVDGGAVEGTPSTLISIGEDGIVTKLR